MVKYTSRHELTKITLLGKAKKYNLETLACRFYGIVGESAFPVFVGTSGIAGLINLYNIVTLDMILK